MPRACNSTPRNSTTSSPIRRTFIGLHASGQLAHVRRGRSPTSTTGGSCCAPCSTTVDLHAGRDWRCATATGPHSTCTACSARRRSRRDAAFSLRGRVHAHGRPLQRDRDGANLRRHGPRRAFLRSRRRSFVVGEDGCGERRLVRMQGFDRESDATDALLDDPRFRSLADIAGDGHVADGARGANRIEALFKPLGVVEGISDVPWHKDCGLGRHSYDCCGLTVGISVTGADAVSGQLRVIAGSHRALVWPARLRAGMRSARDRAADRDRRHHAARLVHAAHGAATDRARTARDVHDVRAAAAQRPRPPPAARACAPCAKRRR